MIRVMIGLLLSITLAIPSLSKGQTEAKRWIDVAGESELIMIPDIVSLSVTLTSFDEDLTKAKQQSDGKLAKLKEIADLFTLPVKNLEIFQFTVMPVFPQGYSNRPPEGYRVWRMVTITLDQLDQYEQFIEALLGARIDQIDQAEFSLSNNAAILDSARTLALLDAEQKAGKLAKVYGLKVGKVLEISEESVRPWRGPTFNRLNRDSGQNADYPANIMGREKMTARIRVKFELKD